MTRPPPLLRHGLVVAATLLLCACQPMGSDDRRLGRTPEFKRNPNPTQAYEITALIEHAREIARRAADAPAPPFMPLQYLPFDPARASDVLQQPPAQVPLRIEPAARTSGPQVDVSAWRDRILEAGRLGDADRFRELTQLAAISEPGRQLRSEAIAHADRQQALEAAMALQASPVGQPHLHTHTPHPPRDPAAPPVMHLG